MRFIAMEMLSLVVCGMLLVGSGAQRCVTGDAPAIRDAASRRLTLNGRILSYESGCHAPLDSAAVRLYLGCLDSDSYEAEPFAGWKTDDDGMFEVTVPFSRDQAGLIRVEICMEPRRSCQPVTVQIPEQKPVSVLVSKPVAVTATKPVSVLASKPVSVQSFGGESVWWTASVSVCLGGRRRRRRAAGWDDMSWLKRGGSRQEASAKVDGEKRGWSNGIPWLKRVQGKRLWEGADEEVGWIKRQDQQKPREGQTAGGSGSADAEDSYNGASSQQTKPSRSRQLPTAGERQLPVLRQRSASKMAAWPHPEEMKKYWAESDMSWL